MEITFDSRLRRMERFVRPNGTEQKTGTEESVSASEQPGTDSLSPSSLSQQTIEKLKEQGRRLTDLLARQAQRQEPKKPALWELDEMKKGEDEADILGENLKTMRKCQEIASRIMRGDKVPPQDEAYLREHDPDGCKLALTMRRPKKDPKEWESVLDEENKASESAGESSETSSSGESSDGGGEAVPVGGE